MVELCIFCLPFSYCLYCFLQIKKNEGKFRASDFEKIMRKEVLIRVISAIRKLQAEEKYSLPVIHADPTLNKDRLAGPAHVCKNCPFTDVPCGQEVSIIDLNTH